MLVGVDVDTPVWQGAGSDGMLGCSAGDGGRRRGVALTGGNPGVVGFSVCCWGSPGPESLTSGLFPSAGLPSEAGASMLGVGASGSVSSGSVSSDTVALGAVTSGGPIEAGRSIAVERFVTARRSLGDDEAGARVLRCALQVQKASEVRPTMAGKKRAHRLLVLCGATLWCISLWCIQDA